MHPKNKVWYTFSYNCNFCNKNVKKHQTIQSISSINGWPVVLANTLTNVGVLNYLDAPKSISW